MLVKREKKPPILVYAVIAIFVFYFTLKISSLSVIDKGFHLEQINTAFNSLLDFSSPLIINKETLVASGTAVLILAIFWQSEQLRSRRNLEKNTYGSAEWGTPGDTKKFQDPDFMKNQIFTATEMFSQNMQISDKNRNVMLLGRPGTGKSRFYYKANLLNANGSLAISDPKGELLRDTGQMLINKGYTIKVLNLRSKWESNCYNPFAYIRKLPKEAYENESLATMLDNRLAEDDVLTLINTIMVNTKPETIQNTTGDPFWEKSEMMFLQALFFYMLTNYPKEEQNFKTIMQLITLAKSEDDEKQTPLDKLFWVWEQKDPQNIGVLQYKNFKISAGSPKTMATIILLAATRLSVFNIKEVSEMTTKDEMEFERIGDPTNGKIAYFIVTDPNNSTFNFLACIFYTQFFSKIDENARKFDGSLPCPVDIYLDEWAQLGEIPRFLENLAYVRGLNCGVTIGLQSLSQGKKVYKDTWETMLDCCDFFLFLGSMSKDSLEYFSVLLGKKTWYKRSSGKTYSRQRSSSTNWDEVGRELATIDELAIMEKGTCILIVAGMKPFYSKLYDIKKHPLYSDLYEPWDKENTESNRYFHLDHIKLSEKDKQLNKIFSAIGLPFVRADETLKMQNVSNSEIAKMHDVYLSKHKFIKEGV